MNRKNIIRGIVGVIALIALVVIYQKVASPTRIAIINYPEFMQAKIADSSESSFIEVDAVDQVNLEEIGDYDMLIFFGMGLKLTEDQLKDIKELSDDGMPIYLEASTDPKLELTNLDSLTLETVKQYSGNGGKHNYRNMLNYIRKEIDKKSLFTEEIETPLEIASDLLFHIDEDAMFESVEKFEEYAVENNIHKDGNKKVILFTSIPGPFNSDRGHLDSIISELERRDLNVYPVSGFMGRINYLKDIKPDLIVYLPHGRLSMGGSSTAIAETLKELNAPILCPLTVHQRYDDWLKDKQGMLGGLLSQSVTMPEFDGGIAPYAVFAEVEDENGYLIFKAIPNRLKKFGDMAENYISLQKLDNSDKKVAFVYFKGPGKNALEAADMEVLPSLHNVLLKMQRSGYDLGDLPKDFESFKEIIMTKGPVLGTYAEGAFDHYLETGEPELLPVDLYNSWCDDTFPSELMADVNSRYGKAPGSYMGVYKDEKEYIAVTRVQFGNVVVMPQPLPGLGDNTFELVHGAKVAPPHSYIAPYLWIQNGFDADAIFHFGTHGSLEFTPGKQIALSDYDWTDPLIGTTPHNYIYTISNIGEAMIAKRRSYAAIQTHLTPPFIQAKAMESHQILLQKLQKYNQSKGSLKHQYALSVKEMVIDLGMSSELGLDSIRSEVYSDNEMSKISNFFEELNSEKVTGGLYTMGVPYSKDKLNETLMMIFVDELAYSMANLDLEKKIITRKDIKNVPLFKANYLTPSRKYVEKVLNSGSYSGVINKIISKKELAEASQWKSNKDKTAAARLKAMMAAMMGKDDKKESGSEKPAGMSMGHPAGVSMGGHPAGIDKAKEEKPTGMPMGHPTGMSAKTDKSEEEPSNDALYTATLNVETTLASILSKKEELQDSPNREFESILNALNGGFTEPSSGGDPIANSSSVPTGRNMFSINAEQTPTKEAWKIAQSLTEDLFEDYRSKHDGKYPEKVSFTLWAGSFIESEGTTIGQILYMLGVEPIWTARGKVNDLRLIPEEELGRPRVDVLVQTSGQLRDLAASRLFIIDRAIEMAAAASSEDNFVSKGKADAEKRLIEKGFSPKDARELSTKRIFGSADGSYGTGIMGMVEKSDSWDSSDAIAKTYIKNMGAVYGSQDNWGEFNSGIFEAALLNTDAVVQPRQSNTWGALSLDHVYEFMGGLNIAVKEVTGNDAESYFNDFRNASNPKLQGLKEAIGVESRTTILNPRYIKEYMNGGGTSAATFAETFRNTFGWNVMKPEVIEDRLWDDIYDVYVEDTHNLGVHEFFERENPYALQEMSAVMLETVRKGLWDATPEQISEMSKLHAELVQKHEAGCSGFVCDNAKLKDFISSKISPELNKSYNKELDNVQQAKKTSEQSNVVLKKQEDNKRANMTEEQRGFSINYTGVAVVSISILVLLLLFVRKRRKVN